MNDVASWTHLPQERDGDYFFDGRALMTSGVQEALSADEVLWVVKTLRRFVRRHSGADYLQVFECDDGRKVWCICQLSQSMKVSGDYVFDDDYWTMLLPDEY